MKRVMIALLMNVFATSFSQVDSTRSHKNEISAYATIFHNGMGAQYAYWYRPKNFLSIGFDVNRVGTPKTESISVPTKNDSLFTLNSYQDFKTSSGINIGIGYMLTRSNPRIVLSTGLLGGGSCRTIWNTKTEYTEINDSTISVIRMGTNESFRMKGMYAGVYGSVGLLADISTSLKFYASASVDVCYQFYNRNIHSSSEISFREAISLGLKYYF